MARNLPSLFGTSFPTAFGSGFGDLRREMDRLFDDFGFARAGNGAGNGGFAMPATEVREDDKQFVISAELAGMKKDDIEIDVHDGVLTIKAEKKAEETKDEDNVHYSERRYGMYRRDFRLGENVDLDNIAADFADGVLTVTLPKAAPAEPEKKRIQIGG